MRILRCALGVFLLLGMLSCGDDTDRQHPDASAAKADASIDAEIATLASDFVQSLDQAYAESCPCYVSMGAYPSVEECLMWQQSRPDWIPCVRPILEKYSNSETLEALRCMRDRLEESRACLASKDCDPVARAECGGSPFECLSGHTEISLAIATTCPDTALLPRLR